MVETREQGGPEVLQSLKFGVGIRHLTEGWAQCHSPILMNAILIHSPGLWRLES